MAKISILGIKVDRLSYAECLSQIDQFLKDDNKHFIITPNPEIIISGHKNLKYGQVLNAADLAIADSPRIAWAYSMQNSNFLGRILKLPLFIFPIFFTKNFPVVTGSNLMEKLILESVKKGFVIGLIGGRKNLAVRLKDRLIQKYPGLKIAFAESKIEVNSLGEITNSFNLIDISQKKTDLIFVAFGHPKQEFWMYKNLPKFNTKVMMGVGGTFDYLVGDVKRAPSLSQTLGFEWLFRLIVQPWRIKRFGALIEFVILELFANK